MDEIYEQAFGLPANVTKADIYAMLNLSIDVWTATTEFALFAGMLVILAYFLSLIVGYLHIRREAVVYPLTKPQPGVFFVEYIILMKTSLKLGSSFDERGRIGIILKGSFADSPRLYLRKGKGIEYFLARGSTNIFVYHSPYSLGEINKINIEIINDVPYEVFNVSWKPCFISIMCPATKEQWGCPLSKKLITKDYYEEEFECLKNTKDQNGIWKSLCLFHLWISMFHNPVRFGAYSNFINVIIVFTAVSLLLALKYIVLLIVQTTAVDPDLFYTSEKYKQVGIASILSTWIIVIVLEAFVRNAKPKSRVPHASAYTGLMPPIDSPYGLDDFDIEYDWDKVLPLLPRKSVVIPYGKVLPSNLHFIKVQPVPNIFNLWGLLNNDEEREWCVFIRSMNQCALSLPVSMRWLSKEASGIKEEVLLKAHDSDLKRPFCVFCPWLIDWPLHYGDEPEEAGLILSHIICIDILTMVALQSKIQRARLAQVCVHQWHGMICRLFLTVIKQSIDQRNETVTTVKGYIEKCRRETKRSTREIQASWRARNHFRSKLGEEVVGEEDNEDENENKRNLLNTTENFSRTPSTVKAIRKMRTRAQLPPQRRDILDLDKIEMGMCEKNQKSFELVDEISLCSYQSYEEDTLLFEELDAPIRKKYVPKSFKYPVFEAGAGRNRLLLSLSKVNENQEYTGESPTVSVLKEAAPAQEQGIRNRKQASRASSTVYWSEEETDMNTNAGSDDDIGKTMTDKLKAINKPETGTMQHTEVQHEQLVWMTMKLATIEKVFIGPPFVEGYERTPDATKHGYVLRHKDELMAYCCNSKRCTVFKDIHCKVGHSSLEILKVIVIDLLRFAENTNKVKVLRKDMWLRKKMVYKMFKAMSRKARMYDDNMFQPGMHLDNEGFMCNQLLTVIYLVLEELVDLVQSLQTNRQLAQKKKRDRLFGVQIYPPDRKRRCLFCAGRLKKDTGSHQLGCDSISKIMKMLIKGITYVAEKEINIEFESKFTIQNYCAMMVNVAKKELLMELEDPPMVLSSKITKAMIVNLLVEMVPRATDFRDMTADELRRLGTRRQRIQARNDPKTGGKMKESVEKKKRKAMIHAMIDELGSRWRVNSKDSTLDYCAGLLGSCLVQEKILGFSIYSGFISKDHEELLNSSRDRLKEIESRAKAAIITVAKKLLTPTLNGVLTSGDEVDVLFMNAKKETEYFMEAVSVIQVLAEPVFLKTCCYYVDDIVRRKIEEFLEFMIYMKRFDPLVNMKGKPKLKMLKPRFKIYSEPFAPQEISSHFAIASPILRWGLSAIRGVPPLPKELLKGNESQFNYEHIITNIENVPPNDPNVESAISKMVRCRRIVKNLMDVVKLENQKNLQNHLARTQAHLTDQLAGASQNMADAYVLETDFQREYRRQELFLVEYYATRNLNTYIMSILNTILCLILGIGAFVFIWFSSLSTAGMKIELVHAWFAYCVFGVVVHILILEPIKCVLYSLLGVYVY